MKYFNNPQTIEELKGQYKTLAKKYHPDINSDGSETMKAINNEYEELFNTLKDNKTNEKASDYMNIINELLKYPNIEIEVIGYWIWLHGKTYAVKEGLKELGFKWSKGKKLWYLNPYDNNNNNKYRYKQNNLDTIRNHYGSKVINSSGSSLQLL